MKNGFILFTRLLPKHDSVNGFQRNPVKQITH